MSNFGRPSIPPEKLLRALLLQALYTIRSERQLMEQIDYNLLFRWFVGLGMDDAVWAPTTFTKNRDRLLDGDIAAAFFDAVLIHADTERLLSDEHFTVDGTLLEAWASQKSFRPRDQDPPTRRRRQSDGEFSRPAADATRRISRRPIPTRGCTRRRAGREARLGYLGHVLMEHRSGLIVKTMVTPADGHGERDAALVMVERRAAVGIGSPSRPTRATTRATSSPACARCASRRTSRSTRPAARQRDRWAHDAARRLRDQSTETEAGRARLRLDEDRSAACASCGTAADRSSTGSSPSPRRRTTSSGFAACWRRPHDARRDDGRGVAASRPLSRPLRPKQIVTIAVTFSAAC